MLRLNYIILFFCILFLSQCFKSEKNTELTAEDWKIMENIPVNELNGLLTKYSIQKRASKISYKKDTIVTYKDMNFTLKPIDLINGKPSNLAIYLDTIEMVIFEYDLSTGEFLQEPTFQ